MELRTIQDIRALVHGRRADLGLTQTELAERAGVSRKWVSTFEAGHETAEIGKVLALLDALELRIHAEPLGAEAGEAPRTTRATDDLATDDMVVLDLRKTLSDYYGDTL
jgi:HTH-type transcriptional regulator/antitoxin HipB